MSPLMVCILLYIYHAVLILKKFRSFTYFYFLKYVAFFNFTAFSIYYSSTYLFYYPSLKYIEVYCILICQDVLHFSTIYEIQSFSCLTYFYGLYFILHLACYSSWSSSILCIFKIHCIFQFFYL